MDIYPRTGRFSNLKKNWNLDNFLDSSVSTFANRFAFAHFWFICHLIFRAFSLPKICYFMEIRVITRTLYIWRLMLSIYKYACSTTPHFVKGVDFEERLDLVLNSKAHSKVWDNFWQLKTLWYHKNAFYFMLKVLLILEIFTLLSRFFVYVEKRIEKKKTVANFKIYDVKNWTTNYCNTHITQYRKE